MENSLENNIIRFVQILRNLGLFIGTSETMDALVAVQNIDITVKNQFQSALKATLIKDAVHYPLFDNAFQKFFVESPLRGEQVAEQEEYLKGLEEAKKDLEFQEDFLDLEDDYIQMYGQLPEKSQEQIKEFLEKTSTGKNVTSKFKPVVEQVIKGALEYHRTHSRLPQMRPFEATGIEEVDAVLHQLAQQEEVKDFYSQNMANIGEKDYLEAKVLIRKLTRRLATRIGRRYRKSSKIKRIDVRGSIRANIKYGGTLLDLKYQQKKVQKPEILLLCDVSGSMIKYSQFTLQFMSGLSEVLPRMEAFVFADTLEKIELKDFSFDNLMKSSNWGEGTNLHVALKTLKKNYSGLLKPITVVIILSDTKSLHGDLAAIELKEMRRKVKDIIWLNPLPGGQWSKHYTVELFRKYAVMWECSTLAHLSSAIQKQLG